ncbi:MAG: FAD-dependent thymidylate synthase [Candidatus Aminicenantes bacterium]|nr:MAG: FAD-dependent thymidylate synthase [Candidatus Aminicenantes bacterium]
MRVILAGYNVDSEVIEDLKKSSLPREDVTPETLSASYARISRDPRPANELRAVAREEVEKARRSNRNIIFKMGHHSVAEHAVFNFDIIGVSRLAIEEIEKFRLCSYTEKSQRYITLGDDFVIPEEVKKAGKEELFTSTIRAQNRLYHMLYKKLKPHIFKKNKEIAEDPKKRSMLDGWAKEDARYVVSLATEGQLGMTVNGRNLELLIRRFASKRLAELKEFNHKIYALAKEVAPSIILFTEASDFNSKTYDELEERAGSFLKQPDESRKQARLVEFTPEADNKLAASLFHTVSSSSFEECIKKAKSLTAEEKKEFLKLAFKYMEFYDFPLREFEYVSLTFDLVISATCFAQLKRHRMATLTAQKYNPDLRVIVPPSIEEIGAKQEFMEMIDRTSDVYSDLKEILEHGAEYVLTNAHRRRALIKVNARELYHISRLREDATAQWDIRRMASEMSKLAREVMPLTCLLIGGKDAYPDVYECIFGKKPKFFPP